MFSRPAEWGSVQVLWFVTFFFLAEKADEVYHVLPDFDLTDVPAWLWTQKQEWRNMQ